MLPRGLTCWRAVQRTVGPLVKPFPPGLRTAPIIPGGPVAGQILATSHGTWTSPDHLSYTIQWQRCDQNGPACANITGATGYNYKLTNADIGHQIQTQITAIDQHAQSQQATAQPVGPILEAAP